MPFSSQALTRFLPMGPAGGLPSPRPLRPLYFKTLATPLLRRVNGVCDTLSRLLL